MTLGRIVNLVDRFKGSSAVLGSAAGTSVLFLDSAVDFNDQGGFLTLDNGAVLAYVARDASIGTVTLGSPLLNAVNVGEGFSIFPPAKEKWAFIALANAHANDAIWAVVPHSLAGFLAANGYREEEAREYVEFEIKGAKQVVVDVINKQPQLQPGAVEPGAITQTEIKDGSITSPLMAANAIAAIHMQADSVSAQAVQSDAIDGMVITAPLIQSAPTTTLGRRTEMGSFGFRVIGPDLGGGEPRTVEVDLGGDKNLFRGSVEAVDIIVQDKLQLYGVNNYMGIGSKITMQTKVSAPGQPPGMSFDYESSSYQYGDPFWWHVTGGWSSADSTNHSEASIFLGGGAISWNGHQYVFPPSTVDPGQSEFKPISSVRIWVGGVKDYLVVYGYAIDKGLSIFGFPLVSELRVYDDTPLKTGGTPILKKVLEFGGPFVNGRTWALGRVFSGVGSTGGDNQVSLAMVDESGIATISVLSVDASFNWSVNVNQAVISTQVSPTAGEVVAGCAWGSTAKMGLAGTDIVSTILFTNKQNVVINTSGWTRQTNYEWPLPYTDQRVVWSSGDVQNNLHSHFYFANFVGSVDGLAQKAYRYSGSHWQSSETWWINYAWRGHTSSPTLITQPSLKANSVARKMARLSVNVPALPAPQAGVGNPRDPAKDVYGWFYYLGKGLSEPGNSSMFKQSVQPSGDPTTVTALNLTVYPTFSGTVPNVVNGFPSATAAAIVSSAVDGGGNPLLSIDGNGLIIGKDILYSGKIESVASDGLGPIVQLQQAAAAGRVGPYRWTTALKPPVGEMGMYVGYSPTITSGTIGTGGSLTGMYTKIQEGIHFQIVLTLGTGFVFNSNTVLGLPVNSNLLSIWGSGIEVVFIDVGSAAYPGVATVSTTGVSGYCVVTSGTYANHSGISTVIPFTWAVGDQAIFGGFVRTV